MKRYITINIYSGYIWGDTLSLPPKDRTPVEAAFDIDYAVDPSNMDGLVYQETSEQSDKGCLVYEVPEGSTMPLVRDGQDQVTIELVMDTCELVAHVIGVDTETGREQ